MRSWIASVSRLGLVAVVVGSVALFACAGRGAPVPSDASPADAAGRDASDAATDAWRADASAFGEPLCTEAGVCVRLECAAPALAGRDVPIAPGEVITVGVPLPAALGVRDATELGMTGVVGAQFRVLTRHEDGSVAWLLMSFEPALDSEGRCDVVLVGGRGSFGGEALAVEADGEIRVDTGAARFLLREGTGDLLDSVLAEGRERLAGSRIFFGTVGHRWVSYPEPGKAAVLEENGPERAVVRLDGQLRDAAGSAGPSYRARLYFVRGEAVVRADLTFRNADPDELVSRAYEGLGVTLQLPSSGSLPYDLVALDGEHWEGQLADGEEAELLQQYVADDPYASGQMNTVYGWPGCTPPARGDRCLPSDPNPDVYGGCRRATTDACPVSCGDCEDYGFGFFPDAAAQGLTVRAAGRELVSTPNALGGAYARFGPTTASMVVMQRWMEEEYPAAVRARADGTVELALRSHVAGLSPATLHWGAHVTRSFLLSFGAIDPVRLRARLDAPLTARAELSLYRATRSFRGSGRVLSADEDSAFARVDGVDYPMDAPAFRVDRMVHWRRNYYASERGVFNFWRGGRALHALQMEARSQYEADAAIVHSDGFDLSTRTDIAEVLGDARGSNRYDGEHQLTEHLLYSYLTTGDERMHEAILDYEEDLLEQIARGEFSFPDTQFYRAWLRRMANIAWLYDFTSDERLGAKLRRGIDLLLDSRAGGDLGSYGRDLSRGFIYRFSGDPYGEDLGLEPNPDHPRLMHSFFGTEISGDVFAEVLSRMRGTAFDYRMEELEDVVLGHAQFLWLEAGTVGVEFRWLGADYCLDEVPDAGRPELAGLCSNQPSPLASFVQENMYSWSSYAMEIYDITGDEAALSAARQAFEAKVRWLESADELSTLREQAVADILLHHAPPRFGYRSLDLSVEPLGSGRYRLSWTAPEGATAYRFKASDRQIVDWLGFDQVTRAFRYDPATHVAWFAAQNLAAEPAPAPAGERQTWVAEFGAGRDAHFDGRFTTQPVVR